MKTFYDFGWKSYGVWQIKSDMPYGDICETNLNKEQLKLLDMPFRICHGKKQRDIICYYESIDIEFLSQNIYDLLSQYGNMVQYLYPIHINDVDDMYYFVHNLPEFRFINRDVKSPDTNRDEISCFLLQDSMPPLFSLNDTRLKIITPEMKTAMIKAKLTNISFEPIYGVSSMEEYYQLQKEGKLRRIEE